MNDEMMKKAQEVFSLVCAMMDSNDWSYEKDEEQWLIRANFTGDDLCMQFQIRIDAERQLVYLTSVLPFKMKEEKLLEGSVVICEINYALADGSFDYNITDGTIGFRMTSCFKDSLVGLELLQYMIDCACYTVDKYNDKLQALNDGEISCDEFIDWLCDKD